MFDTQRIDTFFSNEKNPLDEEEKVFISRRTKVIRFFRLFLPCLTALLCGLGIVLFDFEAHNDRSVVLADEEKIYFEKFRMKNTVFEITEKDNKLSTLKADIVEETEPGKKLYNLTHPYAQSLDGEKLTTIVAKNGVYNQDKQILDLQKDIVANYNEQLEIKTNSATYDFSNETGFGNEKVTGTGSMGNFEANKFTLNKKDGIITLIGDVFMQHKEMSLTSSEKATLFMNDNKFISPHARVTHNKSILNGDIITIYFKDTKTFDLQKINSTGHTEIYSEGKRAFADRGEYHIDNDLLYLYDNVKIIDTNGYTATSDLGIYDKAKQIFTLKKNVKVTDKSGYTATAELGIYNISNKTFSLEKSVKITKKENTIDAPRATYFQNKDEFRFYDNVKITQLDTVATAKSGVYFIKKGIAELENNVIITKNGNTVKGDKAISDLNTSKSRIIAQKGNRIFGKLIENTLKKKKDDADD